MRRRLFQDGVLAPVAVRRVGVRRVLHLPTDPNAAVWPGVRLAGSLSRRDPVIAADALLAGLVAATGLLGHVLWFPDEHAPGWAHAEAIRRGLHPVLAHLVARAEAAVGGPARTCGGLVGPEPDVAQPARRSASVHLAERRRGCGGGSRRRATARP